MKYNVLTDSFIYNGMALSGTLREYSSLEIENLINSNGNVLTVSGAETSLTIDLGFQRSIEKLSYNFNIPSISGLLIKYGRTLDNLTYSSYILTGSGVEVIPNTSGYNYPRYFTINHLASGITVRNITGLQIFNTEEDIDFGISGSIDSISLVAPFNSGYSEIKEVKVLNNGNNTADIYVSVDTNNITKDILNNIEIASTITGSFISVNNSLEVPITIPWEWGIFNNTGINSNNSLVLKDPTVSFPNDSIGSSRTLIKPNNYYSNVPIPLTFSGIYYVATTDINNTIILTDPQRNTVLATSNVPILPTSDPQRFNQGLAWDGNDRIYYIQNNTLREIKYYRLSTNTHHTLTTVSFYVRAYRLLSYINGILYIGGAQDTIGTETSIGTDLWSLNVNTLAYSKISTFNIGVGTSNFCSLNNYIYVYLGGTFRRFNILNNTWQTISIPLSNINSLTANIDLNLIYVGSADSIYTFNPASSSWNGPITTDLMLGTTLEAESSCLCVNNSMIYAYDYNSGFAGSQSAAVRVLDIPPIPVLTATVSGTWISPIFKVNQEDNLYHKVFLDYLTASGSNIKFNSSLGVDNFEIRGSNQSPASDNDIENFESTDIDYFIKGSNSELTDLVVMSGNVLSFSHNFINSSETLYNSAYITFGLQLVTTGKMQYKFWWNPSSNKEVNNNNNYSVFYIAPFIDTLDTGVQPDRDLDTLRRLTDNTIYLRFGKSTDSGGTFTALQFYNGSTTTSYAINAVTGTYYEICLVIDWDIGQYSLYFNGKLLGSSTIPQVRIQLLRNYHTYEIFSGGQNIDFEEKFKRLTISRLGNSLSETFTDIAIPVHREDPLFGTNGSLKWYPVTIHSSLIPKYSYIQLRVTLRTNVYYNYPEVKNIQFPVVLTLSGVQTGETGSVYLRYNFDPSNNLETDVINLKAWMKSDKL